MKTPKDLNSYSTDVALNNAWEDEIFIFDWFLFKSDLNSFVWFTGDINIAVVQAINGTVT